MAASSKLMTSVVLTGAMITGVMCPAALADSINTMTADRLLYFCAHADPKIVSGESNGGICFGYITGIVNTFDILDKVCLPKNTPEGQPALLVFKFLTSHPEMKGWLAPLAILQAAESAYPCATKP